MAKSQAKSSKSKDGKKRKKQPPIYMRIAYGLLQRKPDVYLISDMAMDVFNYNAVQFRRVVMSHFYHARIYLEEEYGEVVVPVRLGGRQVDGYKCADSENEEDVRLVKHEVLRRGIMSESAQKKFAVVIEAVKTQQMLKGGQFGKMQRMIEGEVENREMKKEEQFILHGFRPEEVIPMDKLEDKGGHMKVAVQLYAENVYPNRFTSEEVITAMRSSGMMIKSVNSVQTCMSQLVKDGLLVTERNPNHEGRGKSKVYQAAQDPSK